MKLFNFGASQLPPTAYGYQPPPEAIPVAWKCANQDVCGNGGYEKDVRKWPKQCPNCGSEIVTLTLEAPWQHEAKRVEIDERLQNPESDAERELTEEEDLLWYFEDALIKDDPQAAKDILQKALSSPPTTYFALRCNRFLFLQTAFTYNNPELAVEVLQNWYQHSNLDKQLDDKEWGINARQLATGILSFIEHDTFGISPRGGEIMTLLDMALPYIERELNTDQLNSLERIRRKKKGTFGEIEGFINDLKSIHAYDLSHQRPTDALPEQTARRMEIRAYDSIHAPASGLDTDLVWAISGEPFIEFWQRDPAQFVNKMASEIFDRGGWALVGAERCIWDFLDRDAFNYPNFVALLDAALEYMHTQGLGFYHFTGYESDRWFATH